MDFVRLLNKYNLKIAINKTSLFKDIDQVKSLIEDLGLKVKIKTECDLFAFEVIYRGVLSQNHIENAYQLFMNKNYDLLNYLNYDEKQRLFNNDLEDYLNQAPCFEIDGQKIYIPYYEPFVNQRYTQDYQILMLKQHQEYLKTYRITLDTPVQLYGYGLYRTSLSSLTTVYENDEMIAMYYDALQSAFMFDKEKKTLIYRLCLFDHCVDNIDSEDIKTFMSLLMDEHYQDCLDFMKNNEWISEKIYKKVLKKL